MKRTQILALTLFLASCSSRPAADQDGSVQDRPVLPDRFSEPDRPVLPDRTLDAADSGEATPPPSVRYDFCDDPIWPIPHEAGPNLEIRMDALGDGMLAYRIRIMAPGDLHDEYYVFDIASCTEYDMTSYVSEYGFFAGIGHGRIVLRDRYYINNEDSVTKLKVVDPTTWQVDTVVSIPTGVQYTTGRSNGQVIAYFLTRDPRTDPQKLWLYDLDTGDSTNVWSGGLRYSYMAVTDSFVLFEPFSNDPNCTGAITHYVDLSDLSQADIPETCEKSQHYYFGSGRRIGYLEARGALPAPYTCVVLDLDTHEKWVLTEDDKSDCAGGMDGDIVLWSTGRYRTDNDPSWLIGDIMAMDLATGLQRRLTTEPRLLGAGMYMSLPYAIFYVTRGQYYVVNLEALGIVDGDGHLIDGPPLQEITDLGL